MRASGFMFCFADTTQLTRHHRPAPWRHRQPSLGATSGQLGAVCGGFVAGSANTKRTPPRKPSQTGLDREYIETELRLAQEERRCVTIDCRTHAYSLPRTSVDSNNPSLKPHNILHTLTFGALFHYTSLA